MCQLESAETGAQTMQAAEDKNLELLESELKTIRRAAEHPADYEAADVIGRAVESALCALFEYRLSLEPACEEVPAGAALAA